MSLSKIYLGSNNVAVGKIKLGANDVSAIYLGSTMVYGGSSPTPTLVDYVHTSSATSTANFINTGVYPTTSTVYRIVYKPNSVNSMCLVGFTPPNGTPTTAPNDNTDYRYFYHRGLDDVTLDFNNSRMYKTITFDENGYADITVGNNYITDNLTHTTQSSSTQVSITQGIPIYLSVSSDADFQSLEIWDNNVKVYDGHAGFDGTNYGVYDSISGNFTTQTYGGNTMTGGNVVEYLCFTAEEANSTVTLNIPSGMSVELYSKSTDGTNFTSWDGSTITLANVGDKVYLYGNNNTFATNTNTYCHFVLTGTIAASGDLTTLLTRNGTTTIGYSLAFNQLFFNNPSLTSAPELPATTLSDYCYSGLFQYCTNLTTAPSLPATTLANHCYSYMFDHCTSLTTAPLLAATSTSNGCYTYMFSNCTSLTTAPELPATPSSINCYVAMFDGCSSLNNVKVGATSWNTNYTTNWLNNVSATGTFTKPTNTTIGSGPNGIPNGWTVVNE